MKDKRSQGMGALAYCKRISEKISERKKRAKRERERRKRS
jgi:hypothetical protein